MTAAAAQQQQQQQRAAAAASSSSSSGWRSRGVIILPFTATSSDSPTFVTLKPVYSFNIHVVSSG
jgi:hypothetical protein